MNKKLFIYFMAFSLLSVSNTFGQFNFGEQFQKGLDAGEQARQAREREAYQRELLRQQQELIKKQEEYQIEKVISEIKSTESLTVRNIEKFDLFKCRQITDRINNIINSYKNDNDRAVRYNKYSYTAISDVRDKIYRESSQLLRSKVIMYLSQVVDEKDKLEGFLATHQLTP